MIKCAVHLPLIAAGLILAAGSAFAVDAAGPEPYVAADPVYAPSTKQNFELPPPSRASLGTEADIKGSAAGPQPYTAVDPMYPKTAR